MRHTATPEQHTPDNACPVLRRAARMTILGSTSRKAGPAVVVRRPHSGLYSHDPTGHFHRNQQLSRDDRWTPLTHNDNCAADRVTPRLRRAT